MREEPEILVLSNDEGKRCARCGKVLSLSHFYRCRKAVDTYQPWCKECQAEYRAIRAEQRIRKAASDGKLTVEALAVTVERLSRDVRKLNKLIKYR